METKIFAPANDLANLKYQATNMISRVYSIIQGKTLIKEYIKSPKDIQMLKAMIKVGTLDKFKAEMASLPGFGQTTFDRAFDMNITDIPAFLKVDPYKFKRITGKSLKWIEKTKQLAIRNFPQYKQHYKRLLNI